MKTPFPSIKQLDAMDCGPTCLQMVAKWYGRSYTLQTLRERCHITRAGVSMLGISDAAESIGFRTMGVKLGFDKLQKEAPLPFIAHWNQNHFVVKKNDLILFTFFYFLTNNFSKHINIKRICNSLIINVTTLICT